MKRRVGMYKDKGKGMYEGKEEIEQAVGEKGKGKRAGRRERDIAMAEEERREFDKGKRKG